MIEPRQKATIGQAQRVTPCAGVMLRLSDRLVVFSQQVFMKSCCNLAGDVNLMWYGHGCCAFDRATGCRDSFAGKAARLICAQPAITNQDIGPSFDAATEFQ